MPALFIGALIRKTAVVLCALGGAAAILIAILLIIAPAPLLEPVAEALVVREEPGHAGAIVILLGSDAPDRILAGESLLRRGVADRIVIGSGFMLPSWFAGTPQSLIWHHPALRMKVGLESLGVPPEKITVVDTATAYDTSAELTEIAAYVRARNLAPVVLVSSATHTKRLQIIWRRVAPDLDARVYAADSAEIASWWTDSRLIRNIGYEYAALVKELLRQIRSRVTPPAEPAAPPAEVQIPCSCGA